MKKNETRVAAVIDIGSSAARMCVSQWSKNKLTTLDRLEMPIRIGQEVFSTGRIGFEAMRELSVLLDGFAATAREYGVERPRVIATTALREAANRAHMLDHLRIRNHMDVDVLEEGEANTVIYQEMLRQMGKLSGRALFVNAGSGSMGLALLEDGIFVHARSLRTGTMKLTDMLRHISAVSEHTDLAALEYIGSFLSAARTAGELSGISTAAVVSRGSGALHTLCGGKEEKGIPMIDAEALSGAWEQLRRYSPEQFAARLGLAPEESERVYAELVIFSEIRRLTDLDRLYLPRVELLEAILSLQLRPGTKRAHEDMCHAALLASARETARHYRSDMPHVETVAESAAMLFGKLRKVHGLNRRQGALLEAACVLHECGHYTGSTDSFFSSGGVFLSVGNLLKESGLYLTREKDSYYIGRIISAKATERDAVNAAAALSEEETIFIAKLHALLRLADALDASRSRKGKLIDVELKKNRMILRISVKGDFALEQWVFSQVAPIVEEVFGLEPRLELTRSGPES